MKRYENIQVVVLKVIVLIVLIVLIHVWLTYMNVVGLVKNY